jgi:hypothetical protein
MEVYRIDTGSLDRIEETEIATEENLEEYLIQAEGAEIGGVDILYVDQQGSPGEGGIFDIVGVDYQGNVVVIELKRDRTPRDMVAQALEYAASIRAEEYEQLNERYQDFADSPDHSLRDKHAKFFERADPLSRREFNTDQRLLLVGREFTDLSLDMADFMREHSIDVICVTYSAFTDSSDSLRLLTTENIRRPLVEEPSSVSGGSTDLDRIYTVDIIDGDAVIASFENQRQADLMKAVADYLVREHGLLSHIDLPYSPPNSSQALINDRPEHPDGHEMHTYRELEDGSFLHTNLKGSRKRRYLNHLAQQCGLNARIDI